MRKWKFKDIEEQEDLQRRIAEYFTQEFERINIKSTKRIKRRKENSNKDFLNSSQSTELLLEAKKKRTWKRNILQEMILMF